MIAKLDDLRVAFQRDAILRGNVSLMQTLLADHPNMAEMLGDDPTNFEWAIAGNNHRIAMVRLLIQYGFDVNVDLNH
ncbi:MAG: hypothetical protein KDA59_21230, partial [Planctomycetales bacterium]|nr:hypothetical protein [Planctomycetales bacterium]